MILNDIEVESLNAPVTLVFTPVDVYITNINTQHMAICWVKKLHFNSNNYSPSSLIFIDILIFIYLYMWIYNWKFLLSPSAMLAKFSDIAVHYGVA